MAGTHVSYIEGLRRHIGQAPILMSCAGCAVLDHAGRVLLQQRDDPGGPWGLPGGAMELGETVAQTAIRETREETGIDVEVVELLGVYSGEVRPYANGDVVQAIAVMFTATQVGGAVEVDGGETQDLGWFDLDRLPAPIFAPHEVMLRDLAIGRRGVWT